MRWPVCDTLHPKRVSLGLFYQPSLRREVIMPFICPVDRTRRLRAITRDRLDHVQGVILPVHVHGVAAPRPDAADSRTALKGLLKRNDIGKPGQETKPIADPDDPSGSATVLRPVPNRDTGLNLHHFRRWVRLFVRKHFDPVAPDVGYTSNEDVPDQFFLDWLSLTHYTGADKDRLTRTCQRLRCRRPATDRICGKMTTRPEMAFFKRHRMPVFQVSPSLRGAPGKWKRSRVPKDIMAKGFIKHEWYPLTTMRDRKAARWIQARSDEAKVTFGPWIKLLEHAAYSLRQSGSHVVAPTLEAIREERERSQPEKVADYLQDPPVFIKHVPVRARPDIINALSERNPRARFYATDHTSFEAHFTPAVLVIEQEFYSWMSSKNPQMREVMDCFSHMQSGTNCVDAPWFTYAIEGTRLSGEMNTSLGNGIANFLLVRYMSEMASSAGRDVRMEGYVEGDDGLFAITGPLGIDAWKFRKLGFHIKEDWQDAVNTASFCGNVYDTATKANLTDPLIHIAAFGQHDSPTSSRLSAEARLGLCRAKAMASLAEYRGCPVIQAWAARVLRETKAVRPRVDLLLQDYWTWQTLGQDLGDLSQKLQEWVREPITLGSRKVVESVFHLPVAKQLEIEHILNSGSGRVVHLDRALFPPAFCQFWDDHVTFESR